MEVFPLKNPPPYWLLQRLRRTKRQINQRTSDLCYHICCCFNTTLLSQKKERKKYKYKLGVLKYLLDYYKYEEIKKTLSANNIT